MELINKKKPSDEDFNEALSKFQKAFVEHSVNTFRPRVISFDVEE